MCRGAQEMHKTGLNGGFLGGEGVIALCMTEAAPQRKGSKLHKAVRKDIIAVHDGGSTAAEWEAEPRPGDGLGLVRPCRGSQRG
jgi:hypothetical protein